MTQTLVAPDSVVTIAMEIVTNAMMTRKGDVFGDETDSDFRQVAVESSEYKKGLLGKGYGHGEDHSHSRGHGRGGSRGRGRGCGRGGSPGRSECQNLGNVSSIRQCALVS